MRPGKYFAIFGGIVLALLALAQGTGWSPGTRQCIAPYMKADWGEDTWQKCAQQVSTNRPSETRSIRSRAYHGGK